MPVEILIYIYLGMCAGMILFNIATALLSRRREHRSFRDGIRLELTVSRELDRRAGAPVREAARADPLLSDGA